MSLKEEFINHYNSYGRNPLDPERIYIFETVDSTNTWLKSFVSSKENFIKADGTLAAALCQTAGRGRSGRSFYSPRNSGIYFSLAHKPSDGIIDPPAFTVSAVVGVCRAISYLYSKECQIKWVNDIYIEGRKVCGILTEGFTNPSGTELSGAIIGIGINIIMDEDGAESFQKDLSRKAGGILGSGEKTFVTPMELLARCVYEIRKILLEKEDIFCEYKRRSLLMGKEIMVSPLLLDENSENVYSAVAQDISRDFGLVVKTGDGELKVLHSGEVSLHFTKF